MYLCIQYMIHGSSPWEFPHSEICGSMLICSSPQLIAACHVLHRLLMPRHSPCALVRLNFLRYLIAVCSLLLNCLSFINKYFSVINSSVKRFYPFCFLNFLSTFRWNCNFTQIFRKDLLDLTWLISYLNPFCLCPLICSFLTLQIYFIRFSMNISSIYIDWWAQTRITLQRTAFYMLYIEALRFDPYWTLRFMVGSSGLEPPTSRLSGARSNHLSYEPM